MIRKSKKVILIYFLIIICINTTFIYSKENIPVEFKTSSLDSIYFDFETDLDNWTYTFTTEGSSAYLTDLTSYNGNSSVCVTNRTRFTYILSEDNRIPMTYNTTITFSWGFSNRGGHYIGIMIGTTLASLCLMSHYDFIYVNTSGLIIKSYENENVGTWYYHTLNLSNFYHSYFGIIPEYINSIGLRNRGPGSMSDSIPGDQVTYYDSIFISTSGEVLVQNPNPKPIPIIEDDPDPTLTNTTPIDPTTSDPNYSIIFKTPHFGYFFGSILFICIVILAYKKKKPVIK
jgi:hypothetical protein